MILKEISGSLLFKVGFTGLLSLALLIPLTMVSGIVTERESRRAGAVREVSEKWGFEQVIIGPVLTVPYRLYYKDEHNILRTKIENAYFLPDELAINGALRPELRTRGLYEVVLYRVDDLALTGRFSFPDPGKLRIPEHDMIWEDACVTVGIPDTRGISRRAVLAWDRAEIPFLPGVNNSGLYTTGIHAPLKGFSAGRRSYSFTIRLTLQGSNLLAFVPLGQETTATLTSSWRHPSFTGSYLPASRTITSRGFAAHWKVSYFGRNFPQQWTDSSRVAPASLPQSNFGVTLYQPVDFYQKCVRAVKYGFLFISLTFLAFFMFELFMKLRIHPLQYLMVGSALCLFYLLFLSLSEYMNFVLSYLIACAGVIGMITGYSVTVLGTRARGGAMAGLLVCLYGYLFLLLQEQDYTLLLGSVALFAILGIVMYLTRNIDWYRVSLNGKAE